MESTQQGIIQLIRCAITGEIEPFPAEFDWEAAYPVAMRHGVYPMVYAGAVRCGVDRKQPVMQKLFQKYCTALLRSEQQMGAVSRLCQEFETAGVDYLPLKGTVLKALYPQPELRVMGDADILIRVEQYDRIVPILERLGYTMQTESDHELIWRTDALLLELHKRLIPSYNRDYHTYFADCWKMAVRETYRHSLSAEDEMVYLFTHFAKHYRDGGIGVRQLTDLWVFRRAHPALDEGYVLKALRTLGLAEFYANVLATIEMCFGGGRSDEMTELIADTIFASGLFGTQEAHRLATSLRHGGGRRSRWRRLLRVLFPPQSSLQYRYPVLKTHPWLLPFVWVYRGFATLLFRRGEITANMHEIRAADPDKVDAYRQSLQFVGLRFEEPED